MSLLASLLSQFFTRRAAAFSGTTLIYYDYLVTFPLEVKYIWNAPWTATKAGFLLNRYGNLIAQAFIAMEETGYVHYRSAKFCINFGLFIALFMLFSGESIRILVLMRAWAIWGCTFRVAAFLISLYILYILAVLTAVVYPQIMARQINFTPHLYLEQVHICIVPIVPHVWVTWFATLAIDTVVLMMVGHSLRKLFKASRDLYPSPLIHLLVRDALLFYAASLFNSVFSMICWSVFRTDSRSFLQLAITFPLLSVIGQRLILNLRGFQGRPFTTRDISREVDRQMAAMGDLIWPDLEADDEHENKDPGESSDSDRTRGTVDCDLEAIVMEVRHDRGSPRLDSSFGVAGR